MAVGGGGRAKTLYHGSLVHARNHLARYSERGKKTRQTEKWWEDNIREWTGLVFANSDILTTSLPLSKVQQAIGPNEDILTRHPDSASPRHQ